MSTFDSTRRVYFKSTFQSAFQSTFQVHLYVHFRVHLSSPSFDSIVSIPLFDYAFSSLFVSTSRSNFQVHLYPLFESTFVSTDKKTDMQTISNVFMSKVQNVLKKEKQKRYISFETWDDGIRQIWQRNWRTISCVNISFWLLQQKMIRNVRTWNDIMSVTRK